MNKYFLIPLRKRFAAIWVDPDRVQKWASDWKFFFILGFGRSGTAFMANLLDQAPDAYVFHEPVLEDFYAHLRAHYSPEAATKYMEGFRKKEIYMRMRGLSRGVYGETNGTLRCHANAIKQAFPQAVLLHIVRDGRDVIRSHMSRRTMTIRNPFTVSIHPVESDPWHAKWDGMDRFARICWYWQEENARLRKAIGKTVQFEKILSSYEYLCTRVLEPCDIALDQKAWETAVASPLNVTSRFRMPKWSDWTAEQQKIFIEVCGEEMASCGYSI